MIRHLYRKYWDIGFKSRLYDFLTPQAYLDSMARCVKSVAGKRGGIWLDAGCGSGSSIPFLKERLTSGTRYIGVDRLSSGLGKTSAKARELGVGKYVQCFQSDLAGNLPFKESSIDIVLAHFSTYTISDHAKRALALKNFNEVLKPNGFLIIANPSRKYNAEHIIHQSLRQIKTQNRLLAYMAKKWLIYPLTLGFGLRFIERQLKTETWKAYSLEEFCEEVRSAGFTVTRTETVYANSAYMVVGEKKRRP